MFAPKNILVPTDFSEAADSALKKALDIAYQYQATVYLLHVVKDNFYQWAFIGEFPDNDTVSQWEGRMTQYAEEMIQEQMQAYALARKVRIVPVIKIGQLAKMIERVQEEEHIDLMVIGSPQKQGMLRRFFGSMANQILQTATHPALVVSG